MKNSFIFIIGMLIGAFIFFGIYGTQRINPANDGWLMVYGGDLTQHYLAWRAYRMSEWTFPLCMTNMLSYPQWHSVMFADVIPLFAIFFKVLSPLLPDTFQYFGIFGLLTFMLQGGFAALLLNRLQKILFITFAGTAMLSFMPTIIQRMFAHTTLGSQWFILAALYLWFSGKDIKSERTVIMLWCSLFFFAVWIHMYFVVMMALILLARAVEEFIIAKRSKKLIIMDMLLPLLCSLLALFLIGGLSGASLTDDHPFLMSADLVSFFNSQLNWSRFLPALPVGVKSLTESFAYLGLGFIVLSLFAMGLLIYNTFKKPTRKNRSQVSLKKYMHRFRAYIKKDPRWLLVSLVFLVSVSLGLGISVTILGTEIIKYSLPVIILRAWGIFRATGRFIWVAMYILATFSIVYTAKHIKPVAASIIILIVLLVQFVDIRPFKLHSHDLPAYVTPLQDTAWEDFTDKEHMYFGYGMTYALEWLFPLVDYSLNNNMTVNDFYFARPPIALAMQYEPFAPKSNVLYVFPTKKDVWDSLGGVREIDGYWIGVYEGD